MSACVAVSVYKKYTPTAKKKNIYMKYMRGENDSKQSDEFQANK